jgi:uncharacterized tellurite resistance protein B-like protein
MLSLPQRISLLVHVSKADKEIAEVERELIHAIGERNGLDKEHIDQIINNPSPIPRLRDLPEDEKLEYLYEVIHMMKIDGKIYQSEIQFCERLALQLGYRPGVVADLSTYIYSDPTVTTNWKFLQEIAEKNKL